MPAPPAKTEISDTYPAPSNAVARVGFGKLWDTLFATVGGLLGTTGNPAEARVALGIGPVISFRNLLVNSNFAINQRVYISGAATSGASICTLDRWRVVTSTQSITFAAGAPDRVVTCPAGGLEQLIEAGWIAGGVYTLSWTGTATATVNGVAILTGAQTASLAANTLVTVKFSSGTVDKCQFELGTVATPWERRPPEVELGLCMREFAKSYAMATALAAATAAGAANGSSAVGGVIIVSVPLQVPMRVAPTVSTWTNNGTANQWVAYTVGGGATAYATTLSTVTERSLQISVTIAAAEVWVTGQWAAGTGA